MLYCPKREEINPRDLGLGKTQGEVEFFILKQIKTSSIQVPFQGGSRNRGGDGGGGGGCCLITKYSQINFLNNTNKKLLPTSPFIE